MSLTTGIDIQSFDEVEDSIARFGERYLRRLYSDRELEECADARSLATRFAAKEAVLKALAPHDHIPPWRSIEVLLRRSGGPIVILSGEAELIAREKGLGAIAVSVSATRDRAVAVIIATTEPLERPETSND
jgi:holo-[acyl-carrier protein] synthase